MSLYTVGIAGLVLFGIIALVKLYLKGRSSTPEYPYQKTNSLFTPAERSFLGVLDQAVGEDIQVFGKVRVADVIIPQTGMLGRERQKAFNKISAKHFDFLLCKKNDLSIICAVELNDSSHQSDNRQKRDIFLEGVCNASGIPLIQVPAKAAYNINDIKRLVGVNHTTSAFWSGKPKEPSIDDVSVSKKCPKCSSPMVKRTAKKGEHAGKQFWACSAYPKCRHIQAVAPVAITQV